MSSLVLPSPSQALWPPLPLTRSGGEGKVSMGSTLEVADRRHRVNPVRALALLHRFVIHHSGRLKT
jgi:hypothetical protein